jgi:hypothetical protein
MSRNSKCCVAVARPLSFDVLNSIPKSCASVSMRIPAYWIWACIGAAMSISSIYPHSMICGRW